MRIRLALSALSLSLFVSLAALADPLSSAPPESVGLSSKRLEALTDTLKSNIAKGDIPGAILLVSRRGKIAYFEAMGSLDPEKKTPMTKDAIFGIHSMTKPITTAAAMMLVEQGKLSLSDPISQYIPAFKDMKVGEEKKDAEGKVTLELVPAKSPITVQDLMRHSSRLTYGFFGEGEVKKLYREAHLGDGDPTTAEFVDRLAKLPLVYQPGTTWDYSQSTDVLGRIIEVITGKPLYQSLKDMLLDPLGMTDTSFYVTDPARQARIAEPFPTDRATVGDRRIARKFESGGGGLVSTATDYARFLQMLLDSGTLDGTRYLSPKTIAYMTSDHMGDVIHGGRYYLPGPGYKFGLGFAVRSEAGLAPYPGSPGDFHWGGIGGTAFWVDPKEQMFVVYMMVAPSKRLQYRFLLRDMIYASLLQ